MSEKRARQEQAARGYHAGAKQVGIKLRFKAWPQRITIERLSHIDDALQTRLKTVSGFEASRQTRGNALQLYLNRLTMVYNTLMNAARVPCFDSIRPIEVEEAGDSAAWLISAAVPAPDPVSEAVVKRALVAALGWLDTSLQNSAVDGSALKGFDEMLKSFIDEQGQVMKAGLSSLHMARAAFHRDFPQLVLGGGLVQFGWGSRGTWVSRSAVLADSALGAKISTDKFEAALLLRLAGFPVPSHYRVATFEQAQKASVALGWPVVIKPVDRDRGEGVTTDVSGPESLQQAFVAAKALSGAVLVEEQIAGTCHRINVVDGHITTVMKRCPPRVTGDGRHTVEQLIDAYNTENAERAQHIRRTPLPKDEEARVNARACGFDFHDVPPMGQHVYLRLVQSMAGGGVAEWLTEQIHPENAELARRVASWFGLKVAGVDFITEDISVPWHVNGGRINELNFAPLLTGMTPEGADMMDQTVSLLWPDGGRIPVWVVVGDSAALPHARRRYEAELAQGKRARLVTAQGTETQSGPWIDARPEAALFGHTRAALLDRSTDSLVVWVSSDEWNHLGLPVDRIDGFDVVNERLLATGSAARNSSDGEIQRASAQSVERLIRQLSLHTLRPSH